MGVFRFKQFSVRNDLSPLKVGTDAVVLGASMTLRPGDRFFLDVGTGTGVIALMAAQRLSSSESGDFRIDAIEIDADASGEAAVNFDASPWECFRCFNVALADFRPEQRYDHIFSNPPFFENSLRNPESREAAARHTVSLSYGDILSFSSDFLSDRGHLSLVLPAAVEPSLMRTAASFGLFPFRILRIRTTPCKPVTRLVAEFARGKEDGLREDGLVLQDGPARTPEYTDLTRDFYL